MAIGQLRHAGSLCGFDHHFRAHVDGHGGGVKRSEAEALEPLLMEMSWENPPGRIPGENVGNPQQKNIDHGSFIHFSIRFSKDGLLEGKNHTGTAYSSWGNHGFQFRFSLQSSEPVRKL